MKLIKKSENVQRTYKEDGTYVDVIITINYEVNNDEGNVIGNATANTTSVNMNVYSFKDIDSAKEYLEGLFPEVTE